MRRLVLQLFGLLLGLGLLLPPLQARGQGPAAPAGEPGSELTVYLVTMGHGEAVYEWFGHNTLRIDDARRGTSIAYNYGLFSFEEENFILRFMQGRMWYWMAGFHYEEMIEEYKANRRAVRVQELNLSPARRLALRNYLDWNQLPENRRYLYDYYTANCSTKVRDALDRVVDGRIREQLSKIPTGHTYRWHTRRIGRMNPIMYTVLNHMLGQAGDVPLSAWDEGFLPDYLADHLAGVTVVDAAGREVPLVKSDRIAYQAGRPPLPAAPPTWWPAYLAIGTAVGAALTAGAWLAGRGGAWRWLFAVLAGSWVFAVAFAGWVLVVAWTLTTHTATYRNENLFQFSPLALLLVVLVPWMAFHPRRGRRWGWWLAVAVVTSSVLGLALKATPWFFQTNWELIALMLPANVGLLGAVYILRRRGERVAAATGETPRPVRQDEASGSNE